MISKLVAKDVRVVRRETMQEETAQLVLTQSNSPDYPSNQSLNCGRGLRRYAEDPS